MITGKDYVYWLPFLIPFLFFIGVVSLMLRFYRRIYRKVHTDPDEALDSVLSFAGRFHVDASYVVKFRDSIIGEKLEDFNDLVDDIGGIGEYLTSAEESDIHMFI